MFKRYFRLFLGLFPKQLPIGQTDLNKFCAYVFDLYVIPDLPSYRLAIATMIMHMGPQQAYKSPFWFFRSIRAAQAKEVAYQVIAADREERNKEERISKQAAYNAKVASQVATETLNQAAVTAKLAEQASQVSLATENQSQAV
jgi:hypothetical protein